MPHQVKESESGEKQSDQTNGRQRDPNRLTAAKIEALLKSQNYQCALTGIELTPNNVSVEHIIPLCRGGCHHVSNAQLVLDYVNVSKGTMTNDEFIRMCRDVVAHADRNSDV